MFENINLWFAKDKNDEIITIDKINEDNKHNTYTCPICGSEVIARTGDIKIHHFAYKDKSKCSSESMVHFWIKNELIKVGEIFKIKLDGEVKEYMCKEVLIEKSYETKFGVYKPDITILTESDEIIYFEVTKTNKKKLEDYLDKWLELDNIVVEVNIQDLINNKSIKEFKPLYYIGKCFNIDKESKDYYEFVGSLKIKCKNNEYDKEKVEKLNWLWNDIIKYKNNNLDIKTLVLEIYSIEDYELQEMVVNLLKKSSCSNILNDYIDYNINKTIKYFQTIGNFKVTCEKERFIIDRLYGGIIIDITYNNEHMGKCDISYDYIINNNIIEGLNLKILSKILCYDCNKHKHEYGSQYENFIIEPNKYSNYSINIYNNRGINGSIYIHDDTKYTDILDKMCELYNDYIEKTDILNQVVKKVNTYYDNNVCYLHKDEHDNTRLFLHINNKVETIVNPETFDIISTSLYYANEINSIIKEYLIDDIEEDINSRYKSVIGDWNIRITNDNYTMALYKHNNIHFKIKINKPRLIYTLEEYSMTKETLIEDLINKISLYIRNYNKTINTINNM